MGRLGILAILSALVCVACAGADGGDGASVPAAHLDRTTAVRPPPGPPTTVPDTTTMPPDDVSTAATATTVPHAVEPQRKRLVIHHVGDVNFTTSTHRAFIDHGFDIAFSGMDGMFLRDDLTIVNLECSPSEIGDPMSSKEWSFRCDPASLPVMRRHGVDVVVMANNHSADFGFDALVDGRANLQAAGLDPVGAGKDLAEANSAVIHEIGGWSIAVVAFSGVSGLGYSGIHPKTRALVNPWFAEADAPGIARASEENMTAVVSALDPMVDVVIVSIHQGEMDPDGRHPDALEIERIHWLIDAGADAVVAHHHHRVLPFEYVEGVPIFWGMGNFVWQRLDHRRNTSAVAELVLEPSGTITGRLIPAYIQSSGHPVLRGVPDPAVRSDRDGLV